MFAGKNRTAAIVLTIIIITMFLTPTFFIQPVKAISMTGYSFTATTITVRWTESGWWFFDCYIVHLYYPDGFQVSNYIGNKAETSFTFKDLTPNTHYIICVSDVAKLFDCDRTPFYDIVTSPLMGSSAANSSTSTPNLGATLPSNESITSLPPDEGGSATDFYGVVAIMGSIFAVGAVVGCVVAIVVMRKKTKKSILKSEKA